MVVRISIKELSRIPNKDSQSALLPCFFILFHFLYQRPPRSLMDPVVLLSQNQMQGQISKEK